MYRHGRVGVHLREGGWCPAWVVGSPCHCLLFCRNIFTKPFVKADRVFGLIQAPFETLSYYNPDDRAGVCLLSIPVVHSHTAGVCLLSIPTQLVCACCPFPHSCSNSDRYPVRRLCTPRHLYMSRHNPSRATLSAPLVLCGMHATCPGPVSSPSRSLSCCECRKFPFLTTRKQDSSPNRENTRPSA